METRGCEVLYFFVMKGPGSVAYVPGGGWDLLPSLPIPQMTCMGYMMTYDLLPTILLPINNTIYYLKFASKKGSWRASVVTTFFKNATLAAAWSQLFRGTFLRQTAPNRCALGTICAVCERGAHF